MGMPTDIFVTTVRDTGKSSEYFGLCEVCKTHTSKVQIAQRNRVWTRDDGQHYLAPVGGGTYGHMDCLIASYGMLTSATSFPRDGVGPRLVFDGEFAILAKRANQSTGVAA